MNPFLRAPLLIQTELILTAAEQAGYASLIAGEHREYIESAMLLSLATLDFNCDVDTSDSTRMVALRDGLITFAQAWLSAGPRPLHHGLAVKVVLNYPDAVTAFNHINAENPHTELLAPRAGARLDVLQGAEGIRVIEAAMALAEAL